MDLNKNYYSSLGISNNASTEEIKKSYRKLAKEYHPDANQNKDDSKFKEINEAYSILGNNDERQKYDLHSPHGKNYQPGAENPFFKVNFDGRGFNPFEFAFGGGNPFEDSFFRDMFNRQDEFIENLDININIDVTLKDVYNNKNIPIKFKRNVKCDKCGFTGFDPDSDAFECETCEGKGNDGFTTCKYCSGTGKIHTGTCKKCNGEKVIPKDEEFGFSNSYSIDNSFAKYIRGMGHQSKYYSNRTGTLNIQVNYLHDTHYIRDGKNLIYPLNLHYQMAIDGIDFEYEHLDNKKYSLKIPPKTKDGDLLRIAGKGLMYEENKRGDLLIKVNIIIDYDMLK
jgi:molecular chaperone DnaJ